MRILSIGVFLLISQICYSSSCGKSMLSKTHRKMNDEYWIPASELINKIESDFSSFKREKFPSSELKIRQYLEGLGQIKDWLTKSQKLVQPMITNTDKMLVELKLMKDTVEHFELMKSKMIQYASETSASYELIINEIKFLEKLKSIDPNQMESSLIVISEAFAAAKESTMLGHYRVH